MHGDSAGRRFDGFAAPRRLVELLAADLHGGVRGWDLLDLPDELADRLLELLARDVDGSFVDDLAL